MNLLTMTSYLDGSVEQLETRGRSPTKMAGSTDFFMVLEVRLFL